MYSHSGCYDSPVLTLSHLPESSHSSHNLALASLHVTKTNHRKVCYCQLHFAFTAVCKVVMCYDVDGTCTLAIDTEVEARWYIDAGRWAMGEGRFDHSKVCAPDQICKVLNVTGEPNYEVPRIIWSHHSFVPIRMKNEEVA